MKIGIVVGLGLAIGITVATGCMATADEATVLPAAGPTPLLPEAYAAAVAPAAVPTASAASRSWSSPPRMAALTAAAPAVASAPSVAAAAVTVPAVAAPVAAPRTKPSPGPTGYHPYWVVNIH